MRAASGGASAMRITVPLQRRSVTRDSPVTASNGSDLAEPGVRHRREQFLTRGSLVIPGKRDLAHEVRVRGLEALVPAERAGKPVDAALAADAAHLNRLLHGPHRTSG